MTYNKPDFSNLSDDELIERFIETEKQILVGELWFDNVARFNHLQLRPMSDYRSRFWLKQEIEKRGLLS